MSAIVKLSDRKTREAARRRAAAESIAAILVRFARERQGRFLVFGSAAGGAMNETSDFDVMIDVDERDEAEAWSLIESLGREHDLPVDIHSVRTSRDAFSDRVARAARVLA